MQQRYGEDLPANIIYHEIWNKQERKASTWKKVWESAKYNSFRWIELPFSWTTFHLLWHKLSALPPPFMHKCIWRHCLNEQSSSGMDRLGGSQFLLLLFDDWNWQLMLVAFQFTMEVDTPWVDIMWKSLFGFPCLHALCALQSYGLLKWFLLKSILLICSQSHILVHVQ